MKIVRLLLNSNKEYALFILHMNKYKAWTEVDSAGFSTVCVEVSEQEVEESGKPSVAHWVSLTECSNDGVYCSRCHKKIFKHNYAKRFKLRSKFCPNCGAKMLGMEEL